MPFQKERIIEESVGAHLTEKCPSGVAPPMVHKSGRLIGEAETVHLEAPTEVTVVALNPAFVESTEMFENLTANSEIAGGGPGKKAWKFFVAVTLPRSEHAI